jgi:hypothetical protein
MRRVALGLLVLAFACAGCRKPNEKNEKKEHQIAEHRTSEVAGEPEHRASPAAERAVEEQAAVTDEVREERAQAAEAVARERLAYKRVLVRELELVDRRLSELKTDAMRASGDARNAKDVAVTAARGFRVQLKKDLDDIERTDEDEWPALRERIEHDLDEGRPPQVPRSFEKSFAI